MEKPLLQNGISFEKMKIPEISGFSNSNSINSIGKEKINSLKNSINEIQKLIEEREMLSENFLSEGDEIKLEINNFLIENDKTPKDLTQAGLSQKDFLLEKNSLRNKKIEISELQLNEKINCWKDVALLKKEMRQNERELTEKQSRLEEINDLMNGELKGGFE